MRLGILENGHRLTQKLIIALINRQLGHVPGPIRFLTYRRGWFGAKFVDCLDEGLRGCTEWSIGEIELFAAFVSKLNKCDY